MDLTDVIIDGDPYHYTERLVHDDGTFTGATANEDGLQGEVPAPLAGDQDKVLTGGGIWKADTANLITTYTTQDDANTTAIITSAGGETSISTMESGAKHSRLFNKVSKVALNTRKLINTVKRIWATVATSWASGETYAVGDVRLWTNGHTYVCKLAHTSSSSITPANTTYWKDKTLGDMISSLNFNYNNIAPKLLWFNPHNTYLDAGDVSIPTNNCQFYKIIIGDYNVFDVKVGVTVDLIYGTTPVGLDNNSISMLAGRRVTTTSTKVNFSLGHYKAISSSNWTTGNKISVPK